jgi:hypothetical protein
MEEDIDHALIQRWRRRRILNTHSNQIQKHKDEKQLERSHLDNASLDLVCSDDDDIRDSGALGVLNALEKLRVGLLNLLGANPPSPQLGDESHALEKEVLLARCNEDFRLVESHL